MAYSKTSNNGSASGTGKSYASRALHCDRYIVQLYIFKNQLICC